MRTLSRFAVTVAATALASATALSGAGLANAQFGGEAGSVAADDFSVKSPSTLVSERTADGVDVTYTNETTRSLACFGISAPTNVIKAVDTHVKRYGVNSMTGAAAETLEQRLADLGGPDMVDKVFVLGFDGSVTSGDLGIDPVFSDYLVDPDESRTWSIPAPTGYTAAALVLCSEPNEDYADEDDLLFSYVEYVSTTTSGGTGSGSAGSMGSLGS